MKNEINIYTDRGRLMRPMFYVTKDNKVSWERDAVLKNLDNLSWESIVRGFIPPSENSIPISALENLGSVVEYVDTADEECAFISFKEIIPDRTTHVEIHPSLCLSIMANQIIFPENNPLPRNLF